MLFAVGGCVVVCLMLLVLLVLVVVVLVAVVVVGSVGVGLADGRVGGLPVEWYLLSLA